MADEGDFHLSADDFAVVMAYVLNELVGSIMVQLETGSLSVDEPLINLANRLQGMAGSTIEKRSKTILTKLAAYLIATEPGVDIGKPRAP